MSRLAVICFIMGAMLLVSCATTSRSVERTSADTTIDLSGRWNDTDSRLVAEEMIADVLQRPWLEEFTTVQSKKPILVVGKVRNKSSEHIATATFIKELERELTNSGKVKFVAGDSEREDVRKEREDQQSQAREDTAKKLAAETGADFMLQGTISSVEDAVEGKKVVYYQIDLELVHIETNEKSWIGTKKIKKVISQDKNKW